MRRGEDCEHQTTKAWGKQRDCVQRGEQGVLKRKVGWGHYYVTLRNISPVSE